MPKKSEPAKPATVTLERTFKAPVERIWSMWTTKDGLEKWYWPEPYVGHVVHLDVRVGGRYEIAAEGLRHTSRGTYVEVVPFERLVSLARVDFIPGVDAYDRAEAIAMRSVPGGTHMTFTCDFLPTEEWQRRAMEGFINSLDKLERALEVQP